MNDRKNIDRLFQEKFKDFEVTPDELIWNKIKARQNQKKKRVLLIPFWYRAAGVAALIILISGVSYMYFYGNSQQNTTLTDTNKKVIDTSIDLIEPIKKQEIVVSEKQKNKSIFDEKEKSTSLKNVSTNKQPKQEFLKELIPPKENIVTTTNNSSNVSHKNLTANTKTSPNTFTIHQSITKSKPVNEDIVTKKALAIDNTKKTNLEDLVEDRTFGISTIDENATNTVINTTKANQKDKKSIFDAIANEEEKIEKKPSTSKKWNIAPNIAPVYYNTIGNASSIDAQFSDNNKNGQINMSYGVQISYAINKKVTIRSGINNVDLGYQTENVGFTPATRSQNLQSIDYNTTAEIILISDIENSKISSNITKNPNTPAQNSGLLNQSINYLEIPLEMKFALIDKKVDVNMIGGISTLLLQKNNIYIETGDLETHIGEANNLNNVSFSGNIGFGIDYELSDQFEINLEPIFKYQLNAFNDVSDFKPYYFGIYTGVNIKF